MATIGPCRPTQTVTSLPLLSNVTDAQSAAKKLERTRMARPSGPARVYVSVMYASSWMLLRPFGAMNGFRGTAGAGNGFVVAGLPMKAGAARSSRGSCGMGTGPTPMADAEAPDDAANAAIRQQRATVRRARAGSSLQLPPHGPQGVPGDGPRRPGLLTNRGRGQPLGGAPKGFRGGLVVAEPPQRLHLPHGPAAHHRGGGEFADAELTAQPPVPGLAHPTPQGPRK